MPLFFLIWLSLIPLQVSARTFDQIELYENKLQQALSEGVDRDPVWHSLLHLHKNKPDITDPAFYINKEFVSPRDEFINTFNALFKNHIQDIKCRFPARFLWMKTKLQLEDEQLGACPLFELYSEKVFIDKISIVFAAENISVPASMMGHVFLKLSGTNLEGEEREHAISFFTNTQNVNALELIFKSFLTGMKGYYTLSPYQVQKNAYLYNEQRNIWEYDLKITKEQVLLLKNHLYELKDISFDYFFHWFNCATLINNLLSVPFPEIGNYRTAWVTPLDVVRAINDKKIVGETKVIPASAWKIKAIQDSINIDADNLELIKERKYSSLALNSYSKEDQFLVWELARGYNNFLSEEDKISRVEWDKNDNELSSQRNKTIEHAVLDPSSYKAPHQTIKNSQVFGGYSRRGGSNLLRIGYLPISHSLFDDNSQYINESELKLGELILSYEEKIKRLKVDSLTLYSLAILNPTDVLLNGFAWKFNVGYYPRVNSEFIYESLYCVEGGVGKSFKINRDFDAFTFLNLGLRDKHDLNIATGPEIGFMIREIFGMKTFLSFGREYMFGTTHLNLNRLNVVQAINHKNNAINLSYSKSFNSDKEISDFSLIYKIIY